MAAVPMGCETEKKFFVIQDFHAASVALLPPATADPGVCSPADSVLRTG